MVNHILENHKEVRTDKCDICSFVTIGSQTLKNHKLCHKDIRMHECNQCDFKSTLRADVVRHRKNVHGVSFEYMCELCGKDFHDVSKLNFHKSKSRCSWGERTKQTPKPRLKTIHETKCKFCNYETTSFMGLNLHIRRMHEKADSQLGTSICDRCGFSALDSIDLKKHIDEEHSIFPSSSQSINIFS